MKSLITAAVFSLAVASPQISSAATSTFAATLTELNNSGVAGTARLVFDDVAMTLAVNVNATGLEPDSVHVQHIHGHPGGQQSVTPSFALGSDADGDGFIELAEGRPFYGPIILSLTDDTQMGFDGFPTAPGGVIDFSFTYDLMTTSAFGAGLTLADLLPLGVREIIIHGLTAPAGVGAGTPGEVNGAGGYQAVLPVAAGQFSAVPLPAAGWLLLTAFGGLFGVSRFRGRASAA